ncbi:DUF2797 domain-containing protein [Congregibacter variabilis]|uniref:DUF2797 domain-containing protein n=1 Tax=Congregibacter variabilis TaxID=3081200 RepID=A0ABZ0I5E1_9GAMM|nr:DUF2797 domain-containing protein [Congregibacter sp. IMCC43200]
MAVILGEGGIRKMRSELSNGRVKYALPMGDGSVPLNDLLGQSISLSFLGAIHCINCARKTKKSFNQGFCYPCFQRLAQCDSCIMSPQKCHYAAGTCREPEWGDANCMVDHFVYLANTSGLKVGITRHTQLPTRWIDQGATQALPAFRVASRLDSGLVEIAFAAHVADKTAWQRMLKGANDPMDLPAERARLTEICAGAIQELRDERGIDAITTLEAGDVTEIDYPVLEYPTKVKSMTFDKMPEVTGTLLGIKAQYLILDTGVINMRRHAGYQIALSQTTES